MAGIAHQNSSGSRHMTTPAACLDLALVRRNVSPSIKANRVRQRTAALQNLAVLRALQNGASASWSAAVLCRFSKKVEMPGAGPDRSTSQRVEGRSVRHSERQSGVGAGRAALLIGLLLLVSAGCTSPRSAETLQRHEYHSDHMGTLFTIVLYATDANDARDAAQVAFERINALDETLSDYRADSELNLLREKPVGVSVPVSRDLFEVLERSRRMSRLSAGAFDATIGPYVRLWRFSRKRHVLPGAEELSEARQAVGWQIPGAGSGKTNGCHEGPGNAARCGRHCQRVCGG